MITVSVHFLRQENKMIKTVKTVKIEISGLPSAGKSTVSQIIKEALTNAGLPVLVAGIERSVKKEIQALRICSLKKNGTIVLLTERYVSRPLRSPKK